MALRKCHECGKEISTEAKRCPNCGKKDPTTPYIAKLIRAILWLVLISTAYSLISSLIDFGSLSPDVVYQNERQRLNGIETESREPSPTSLGDVEPAMSREELADVEQALADAMQLGVIRSWSVRTGEAFVEPALWNRLSYQTKDGMLAALSGQRKVRGPGPFVRIRNYYTGEVYAEITLRHPFGIVHK